MMNRITSPMNGLPISLFVGLNLLLAVAMAPPLVLAQQEAGADIESRGLPGQPLSPPLPSAMPLKQGLPSLGATCLPVEVSTTKDRVQIKCKVPLQAPAGLQFFAVGTDDPAFASRVMKLAATAQIANAQIQIVFNPSDPGGERIGCQANNCRMIQAITLIDN